MDFLWRKVSEKEKDEIRQQAEKIMEKFSKRLDKIKLPNKIETSQAKDFDRPEDLKTNLEIDRKIMFSNALHKNKDFIISEKGEW